MTSEAQNNDMHNVRLHQNPSRAAKQMEKIIADMIDVYEAETQALNASDTARFQALQEHKIAATQHYQNGMSQMLARKDEMKAIDEGIKNNLRQLQTRFTNMSSENIKALGRMKRATEKLGAVIRNAAKDNAQQQRGFSYGENGHMSHITKQKAISMGMNETV